MEIGTIMAIIVGAPTLILLLAVAYGLCAIGCAYMVKGVWIAVQEIWRV